MSVSSDIKNMSIYHFYLRDEPVLVQDQKLNWDERLVEADVPNAIYRLMILLSIKTPVYLGSTVNKMALLAGNI